MKRLVLRCSMGLWAFVVVLGTACSDDDVCAGVADRCETAEAAQCQGDTVQVCQLNADGCWVWTDSESCTTSQTCTDGQCVCNDVCAYGDERCDQDVIQLCFNSGGCYIWQDVEDCGVDGGTCYDPGTPQCIGADGCGNETIEGSEVCDGSQLGGEDCLSQGFDVGTLACNDTCDAFDTSGCASYPPGGTCDDAYDLTGETFPFTLTGTFPNHPAVGFSCDSSATNVVWYHYTPAATAQYLITASGTNPEAWGRLVVLDGIGCASYDAELACVESLTSQVAATVPLSAGVTYLIALFTDGTPYSMVDPQIDIQTQ